MCYNMLKLVWLQNVKREFLHNIDGMAKTTYYFMMYKHAVMFVGVKTNGC